MAHSNALAGLLGELVASLTPTNLPARELKLCRDHATRAVRHHPYGRTNQFDVDKTLDGLLEKFQVLNREDLADALDTRLRQLNARPSKWTPEILSLLLQLSDRPNEKTVLSKLEELRAPEAPSQLTWAEIIADEPLNEEGIWNDIDYAAHGSSDEDEFEVLPEDLPAPTPASSVEDESYVHHARSYIVQPNFEAAQDVKASQQRLEAIKLGETDHATLEPPTITELALIRECIMMLRGLPNTLFSLDERSGRFSLANDMLLCQTSTTSVNHILQELVQLASSLQQLRLWAEGLQKSPLLRILQTCVHDQLYALSSRLLDIELPLMRASDGTVVSIVRVSATVREASAILLELHQVVPALVAQRPEYLYLEQMYDRICLVQSAGETRIFTELVQIFSRCLSIYLRPVRAWMDSGTLSSEDDSFFITDSKPGSQSDDPSYDRFVLKRIADNNPLAPAFLHASCVRILNAGRSVKLIRALSGDVESTGHPIEEDNMDLAAVSATDTTSVFEPFSECLSAALTDWVARHHAYSSSAVKVRLIEQCGLWQSLDALEYLYLARDGSLTQTFVDILTDKIDRGSTSWNDRFFITDLLQETFKDVTVVDPDLVVATSGKLRKGAGKLQKLATVGITYKLHWSMHVVFRASSLSLYQKLLSLNLQLRYLTCRLQSTLLSQGALSGSTRGGKHAGALRFRLTRFISVLQDYICGTVVETQTKLMRRRLVEAQDIDEMALIHASYVSRVETQAIMSKNMQAIRSAMMQALELCLVFCEAHARQAGQASEDRPTRRQNRHRRKPSVNLDDLSEEDQNQGFESDDNEHEQYHADAESYAGMSGKYSGPYQERIQKMDRDFIKLNAFIINGLRGVARAGGESTFGMLAERLE